ncbi:putative tyrosinase protein [Rosellinia necatrix]|uniref:Putative tyrosinase protein n=1 Tax=Rosellinia necatrix TaxID=77044 RepID=A0A1W2TQH1_ROSNE|nr:putative tyrosinase protein [Rosellinia necatrix]
MRYSIASQAICGAITVSALAVPSTQVQKRVQLVDISNFKSFPTADPQQFFDKADDAIREFFNVGMFNDGPMDKSGKWVDRPLAVLEDVGGGLELHFEQIKDKLENFQEKIEDKIENFQQKAQGKAHGLGGAVKHNAIGGLLGGLGSRLTSGSKPEFPDFNDIFGVKQPSQPEAPEEPEQPAQTTPAAPATPASTTSTEASKPTMTVEDDGDKAATCDPSNAHVRFEWSSYSRSDRTAFVKAIKCLQGKPSGGSKFTGSRNRYEDLISVHRGMTANVHQTATFLVWHRYFVWVFEQMLRNECGFDRAMPWWDETKHAGAFAASDVFTDEWFGHLPPKTSNGQGTCIESGEFAGTTLHVGPGNNNENHCLSRAVDESQTAQCNKDFTNACLAMKTYDEFRDCFELGPHGYGHNGIGAVMAEVSASVGDPVFFMHHLFVDHTFRIWQNANPSRRTSISGCADTKSPCTPITLDTRLSSNGLAPDLAVRDILNTLSGTVCYRYNY